MIRSAGASLDEVVVMDFDRQVAHRLSGEAAEVFLSVHRGRPLTSVTEEIVDGLIACGLLRAEDEARPVVGRRALISTAAAIGVSTLVLPASSAAASSAGPTGFMVSSSTPYFGVAEFTVSESSGGSVELAGVMTDYFTANGNAPRYVDSETQATRPVVSGSVFTVPNGVNTITIHAYATSGEGASGNFTVDETFGYSLGGTVTMSYAVLPGDQFEIVAGGSAPGGSGATATAQYGVLRGGAGGRGVGVYKIGQDPVWIAVAGGGGGVGGVDASANGRGPNGGSGGINTSKANGIASAFLGSGGGGSNGVAQPGGGAAGHDGVGTVDDGGSGSANGRTPVSTTTTTAPTVPEIPELWLGDGGAGGAGGIGGGGGGSGYFGGGGGGAGSGAGSAASLGYGGGGGAGGSYVVALGLVGTPSYDWAHTPLAAGPKVVIEFDLAS